MKVITVPAEIATQANTQSIGIHRRFILQILEKYILVEDAEGYITSAIMQHLDWMKFPARMCIITVNYCQNCECYNCDDARRRIETMKEIEEQNIHKHIQDACRCTDEDEDEHGRYNPGLCSTFVYKQKIDHGSFIYYPTNELLNCYRGSSIKKLERDLNKITRVGEDLHGNYNFITGCRTSIYIRDICGRIFLYAQMQDETHSYNGNSISIYYNNYIREINTSIHERKKDRVIILQLSHELVHYTKWVFLHLNP